MIVIIVTAILVNAPKSGIVAIADFEHVELK